MDGDVSPVTRPELSPVGRVSRAPPSRVRQAAWFVGVLVLVGLVLGGLYGFNAYRDKAIANYFATNKPPPTQISAVVATTGVVPHYASGIGSLAAVHQVTITPEVGGRITEIAFESGASVKAGDKIVQINDGPDRGDLASYQAQQRWAQVSLQRAQALAAHQYGPESNVDSATNQLGQAQAMILKTEAVIAQKNIRAPFGGKLGVRQVEVGQYLNPGAPIVTLTDLSTLYVNFTLPSHLSPEILVGQKVEVTTDAFPGRKFAATITTIEPQISASTRTINVQATMPNPDEALRPGMFVDAAVVLPDQPPVVVLPETAVEYTLYGDSVYVLSPSGTGADGKPTFTAHRKAVKTGLRWDNKVAVLSGVKQGDEVVAAGQIKVQDGAVVAVTGNPPPQPPEKLTRQ
jgi:multidrug efflux system membrane fusion protein